MKRASLLSGAEGQPAYWRYSLPTNGIRKRVGQVIAHTKSEARAKLKAMFKLRRVPVGTTIKKVNQ